MAEPPKPPKFRETRIDMGVLDYERYNNIIQRLDELKVKVTPPKIRIDLIPDYCTHLDLLYMNFRPLIFPNERAKYDGKFNAIFEKILSFGDSVMNDIHKNKQIQIDKKLLITLREMHMFLLDLKQMVGLGVPLRNRESLKKKLKRVMLGEME